MPASSVPPDEFERQRHTESTLRLQNIARERHIRLHNERVQAEEQALVDELHAGIVAFLREQQS